MSAKHSAIFLPLKKVFMTCEDFSRWFSMSVKSTLRARNKRVKSPDKLHSFKKEIVQLYRMFRKNVEDLCKKYGAEINYWYTPSEIPQPKFIMDGVGFDADQLVNEAEKTNVRDRPKIRKTRR